MYKLEPLYTPVFWLYQLVSQGISTADEVTIPSSCSPPPFRHLCVLSAGRRYMPHCNNRYFAWKTFFIYSCLITGDHNVKPSMRVQWLLKQERHNRSVKENLIRMMVCCTGMLDTWKIQRIWLEQYCRQVLLASILW